MRNKLEYTRRTKTKRDASKYAHDPQRDRADFFHTSVLLSKSESDKIY